MAFQKVEFTFPEEENNIEVEGTDAVEIDLSGSKTADEYADTSVELKTEAEKEVDDLEIEVFDDTPEVDRNRKPSEPPADVTDEELEGYSEKVKNRIKHFSKGYHDERRAKEAAERERVELERLAQKLLGENRELKGNVTKNQEALLEQAKKNAAIEMESAKRSYKNAYDEGDSEALLEAQDKLTSAKIKTDKLNNFQIPALQEEEIAVQEPQDVETTVPRDPNAEAWVAKNPWFNEDPEMRSFAYGVHEKLIQQGVSPQDDTYYERIDARMRQVFPDYFGEQIKDSEPKRRPNVVAPATRSTVPKKVQLSQTQVALAKRLGVPLEEYAKQVALEMRKA
jgi:hypothetical protein|tara:strand:- start:144 stop:1160 length:1017 start_codon:yes stop_codon:yes gene_type:complete